MPVAVDGLSPGHLNEPHFTHSTTPHSTPPSPHIHTLYTSALLSSTHLVNHMLSSRTPFMLHIFSVLHVLSKREHCLHANAAHGKFLWWPPPCLEFLWRSKAADIDWSEKINRPEYCVLKIYPPFSLRAFYLLFNSVFTSYVCFDQWEWWYWWCIVNWVHCSDRTPHCHAQMTTHVHAAAPGMLCSSRPRPGELKMKWDSTMFVVILNVCIAGLSKMNMQTNITICCISYEINSALSRIVELKDISIQTHKWKMVMYVGTCIWGNDRKTK